MSSVNPYQAPSASLNVPNSEAYSEVKFFSTKGRLGRIRYITYSFGYVLIFSLVMAVLFGLMGAMGLFKDPSTVGTVTRPLQIVFMGFGLILSRRRAHDFDKSGWWALLSLIPLVNLIFLFIPGTDGENRYGNKTPPNKGGAAILIVAVLLVAIIGILAAIAIPAYQQYVNRAKAAQGQIVAPLSR